MNREVVKFNNKPIGWIEEGEFYTPKKQNHIMRKFGFCFGMNVECLAMLRDMGLQVLNFLYQRIDGKTDLYLGTVSQFLKSPHEFRWNGELQKFVRLSDLIKKKAPVIIQSSLEGFVSS